MKINKSSYTDDKLNLMNYIMTNNLRFIYNLTNNSLNNNCNFYVSQELCKENVSTDVYSNDTINDKLKKLITNVIRHYNRSFDDLAMINFYKLSNSIGIHEDTSYCNFTFNFEEVSSIISLIEKYDSNMILIDASEDVEFIYANLTKHDILYKYSFIEFDLKEKHALITNVPILVMTYIFKNNS
jgi:hypothetical protein